MSKYKPTFGPYLELHSVKGEYVTVLKQQSSYNCGSTSDNKGESHTLKKIRIEEGLPADLDSESSSAGMQQPAKNTELAVFVQEVLASLWQSFESIARNLQETYSKAPQSAAPKTHRSSRRKNVDYIGQLKVVTCLLLLAFLAGFFQHYFGSRISSSTTAEAIEKQVEAERIVEEKIVEIPALPIDEPVPAAAKPQLPAPTARDAVEKPHPRVIQLPKRNLAEAPVITRPAPVMNKQDREKINRELIELFEQLDPSELPQEARDELRNSIMGIE